MTPPYGIRRRPVYDGCRDRCHERRGMRSSKVGLGGGDAPKRVVGLRTKPPPNPCSTPPRASKCTTPPRAKLGVDPTTQAVAMSITVKTRFMITTPHLRGRECSYSSSPIDLLPDV